MNSRTFAIIFDDRSYLVQITSSTLQCLLVRDFDKKFCHPAHSKQRASKNKADNTSAYTKLKITRSSSERTNETKKSAFVTKATCGDVRPQNMIKRLGNILRKKKSHRSQPFTFLIIIISFK